MWDWEKGWANTMMFEGHVHYVMAVTFNPKDPNTFATASLDRTIKVWNKSAYLCNFTLEGHTQGVNCVEYYHGGDKPYLISGSDDRTVKIWDYQTKSCVQTLFNHSHNVSSVMFFPDRPLIITGSEDETVKIWQLQTYRLEANLDHGMHRVWALCAKPGSNKLAIGCDKGTVVLRIGKEEPTFSMDNNGKILVANNHEVIQMSLKGNVAPDVSDGEKIILPQKEMGTCENVPKRIAHNSTGQYVAVLFEDEYTINTTLAWRAQCFGKAIDFVWADDVKTFAILEDPTTIKIFAGFKERSAMTGLGMNVDRLFGGPLLGARSSNIQQVVFYDWQTQLPIRQIDIQPKSVCWNETGEMACLITDTSFFILRYNKALVQETIESGVEIPEDGIEDAFTVVTHVEEKVRQGTWVGDCFIYVCRNQRLNYYMGGEEYNLAVLEKPMFLLGYVPKDNRVYLTDKTRNVVSYQFFQSVIDFQTAVVRGDLSSATEQFLPKIPAAQRGTIAQFLDNQGFKELALEVATEDEHIFNLSISLHNLDRAVEIAKKDEEHAKLRWKQIGDLALQHARFDLAAEALAKGEDYNGLLLLYSSLEDSEGLKKVAELAAAKNRHNVAFTAYHLVGDMRKCVSLLCETDRVPEAALFARSYAPELVPECVDKWRTYLGTSKFANAMASPDEFPNLFPEIGALFEKKQEVKEEEAVAPEEEQAEEAPAPASPVQEEPATQPAVEAEAEVEDEEVVEEPAAAQSPSPELVAETPSSPPAAEAPQAVEASPAEASPTQDLDEIFADDETDIKMDTVDDAEIEDMFE
eukprot:TRINITY_DN1244_c0_g1_i1.p1 TRINITY_DN1244_c0_g1~~TRINITY_DN1244_c0_g1_i1.p1  ORF type:complete len:946 (+),score=366.21 TRINITY_DN1244_c0_g1_i1:422-2839(+)